MFVGGGVREVAPRESLAECGSQYIRIYNIAPLAGVELINLPAVKGQCNFDHGHIFRTAPPRLTRFTLTVYSAVVDNLIVAI